MNIVSLRSPIFGRSLALAVATIATAAAALSFAVPAQAADVALGPVASTFGVLAGAGVTNTGATTISGSVGDSPDASIGGFPPGLISNGTKHANDGVAATAQSERTSAYLRAAAEPTTTTRSTVGTGETLKAGVYESASSLSIDGSLTLDGEGNPNAMFVFKAGSTLDATDNSTVSLINGANSCNVYWQVGSSATLDTDASFRGTILALTAISAKAGATVDGRLLAGGAVTLIDDSITVPDCSSAGGSSSSSGPSTSPAGSTGAGSSATSGPTSSTTAPTVGSISPGEGPTGGGTVVTVTGSGLVPGGTTVTVGGQTIPTSDVHVTGSTTATFRTPAHPAGQVNVTVHTSGGPSRSVGFTYTGITTTSTTTTLASTGTQVRSISELGGLLLLAGGAVLLVSRRRMRPTHRR